MRRLRSLRYRLILSYLVMALLLLTIAGAVFSRVVGQYADSVERERRASYQVQVHNYLSDLEVNGYPAGEALALVKEAFPEVTAELFTGDRPGKGQPPRFDGRNSVLQGRDRGLAEGALTFQERYNAVAFQFTIPPATPGELFRTFMLQILAILGLAFALAALIGWWLSRWLSRPISALSGATAAVAAGDYDRSVEPVDVSELDELVTQFNRMLLSVQESLRALTAERDRAKRFASDAAHELKTPLATLRAYADVLAERPERLGQALPSLERQIDRMEYTVSGLLEIANISEGTGLRLETQDLVGAVRQLEPWLHDLAEDYGQELAFETPASALPVRLDQSLLTRLLNNLVDNACKYGREGALVRLTLQQEGQMAVLSVIDQGRGIAQADLPLLFDRFHRGIDTQEIRGTGLGLAIVKEAVGRLGGRIEVESQLGVGSTFRVRLPLVHS